MKLYRKIRSELARHALNYRGWRTDRKLIVIESDDWGSVRMPSREAYQRLLEGGVDVNNSAYCRYDSLASEEDLTLLFDLLLSVKDRNGRNPAFTANSVLTNPDFDKIRCDGFEKYHSENFTETLKRYPNHQNSFTLWKQGMEGGIFHPQFHGKEHLNVAFWLRLLRENWNDFQLAFDNECWGLSGDVYPGMGRSVQATFDYSEDEEIGQHHENIVSGLDLFEKVFGYRSLSFIANNFIWSEELNRTLADCGVRYLQGMKYQLLPTKKGGKRELIRHYTGEKNKLGQLYLIRNCIFEPSLRKESYDNVGNCMKGIKTAFQWKKPANISTHRLNYIGFIDPDNRKRGLTQLEQLLHKILREWPEAEFITSDELGQLIETGDFKKKSIDIARESDVEKTSVPFRQI